MPENHPKIATLPANFAGLHFDNTYANLPEQFYSSVQPTPVREPHRIKVNHELAEELQLDPQTLESPEGIAMLAGNAIPSGAQPLAQAYAGHQFGYLSPQLGDGRAILLGEVVDRNGLRRDIQLKGSGPTPYSRSGDGRAALGPVVREYVVSEAMHVLGIKTTRALAAVTTGEQVYRQTALPGAVLTRIASSHVRIGTFEYFQARGEKESVKQLADFVIQRHYPHAQQADSPYLALLAAVIDAQASLVASWLHVGFIHGVMNTDNMSISGETIDYGPCAFMNRYDPKTVFSSIDREGRYAYGNQPSMALWNLSRFAESLLPWLDDDTEQAVAKAQQQLQDFPDAFTRYWASGMRLKIGLHTDHEEDWPLVEALLQLMQATAMDYTQTFRFLSDYLDEHPEKNSSEKLSGLLQNDPACDADPQGLQDWLTDWQKRLTKESRTAQEIADGMRQVNPVYIPRNHLVEAMLGAAVEHGDYAPMEEMLRVLGNPFQEQPGMAHYGEPPEASEQAYKTFCGT